MRAISSSFFFSYFRFIIASNATTRNSALVLRHASFLKLVYIYIFFLFVLILFYLHGDTDNTPDKIV